ncbi:hypothetical protein ACFQ22_02215 [Lentilactobacillus raoultii]|uniref:Uncharacterized protein n=1 Tax=Lentilactobacillus raoultii TaxID=1987503 RepID=A0ABW3PJP2_9LACO|nr:hypothetical protein [Lentilactobacillus raoultii]
MKKHLILLLSVIALVAGFAFATTQTNARAASAIPISFRGHWHNYDNGAHITITAHYVKMFKHFKHVRYVSRSGSWYMVHFLHSYPIYLHYG